MNNRTRLTITMIKKASVLSALIFYGTCSISRVITTRNVYNSISYLLNTVPYTTTATLVNIIYFLYNLTGREYFLIMPGIACALIHNNSSSFWWEVLGYGFLPSTIMLNVAILSLCNPSEVACNIVTCAQASCILAICYLGIMQAFSEIFQAEAASGMSYIMHGGRLEREIMNRYLPHCASKIPAAVISVIALLLPCVCAYVEL